MLLEGIDNQGISNRLTSAICWSTVYVICLERKKQTKFKQLPRSATTLDVPVEDEKTFDTLFTKFLEL